MCYSHEKKKHKISNDALSISRRKKETQQTVVTVTSKSRRPENLSFTVSELSPLTTSILRHCHY